MIALAPLKDKEIIKKHFKEQDVLYSENSGCVTALDKDKLIGLCLYDLTEDKMVIKKIVPENDLMLADGILRSTLHVAAERSIMNAFCEQECEAICDKLGFIIKREEKSLNINKLFGSCCSCKK